MEAPLESDQFRRKEIGSFALWVALVAVALAALPLLIGWIGQSEGRVYLQQQTALDDQMVYAAWMRQAMEGRILFENRFAVDAQPGLTFHLYFLVLGWVAKAVGVLSAMSLARLAFSGLFVLLLGRLLYRLGLPILTAKIALCLASFGAGLGFLAWETFGREITGSSPVRVITGGWLPIDVWQPEAFAFSSMLTNGLFMASLCLIVLVLHAAIEAKESWRPVFGGAVAFGVLMNIHSYDALLILFVLLGWLAALVGGKHVTGEWIARVAAIGAGAVPAAAWFVYVLSRDPVFQARAATETFSAAFPATIAGILPLAVGAIALAVMSKESSVAVRRGAGLIAALLLGIFALSWGAAPDKFLLPMAAWVIVFAACLAILWSLKLEDPLAGLIWSWALIGLVAIYFPALFQRKLAMGLAIPWAMLAAVHLGPMLRPLDRHRRNFSVGLALVAVSGSSVLWLQRELLFIRTDVSSTTLQSVYLTKDSAEVLEALSREPGRKIAISLPGVPRKTATGFQSPYVPDLNPMLAGLSGAVAYAGHWSETPNYGERREKASRIFLQATNDQERRQILQESGVTHLLAPDPAAFDQLPLADLSGLGETVSRHGAWSVIRVRPSASPAP